MWVKAYLLKVAINISLLYRWLSRFTYTSLMNKEQAFYMFNTYTFEDENWKKKRIQIDRGGEVVSHWFSCYCEENAIVRQTSVPYTQKKKKKEMFW